MDNESSIPVYDNCSACLHTVGMPSQVVASCSAQCNVEILSACAVLLQVNPQVRVMSYCIVSGTGAANMLSSWCESLC